MDDLPDIDELLETLDSSMVSITVLKGVGGHTVRLEPCDNVRCSSMLEFLFVVLNQSVSHVRVDYRR